LTRLFERIESVESVERQNAGHGKAYKIESDPLTGTEVFE
jgi:hypothetical protein